MVLQKEVQFKKTIMQRFLMKQKYTLTSLKDMKDFLCIKLS